MPSNKLVSGALYWRSINTENFVIRGGGNNSWRTQFSFWISVNLSDTFKTNMKKNKQLFYVTILRREKDSAQPIASYLVYSRYKLILI